MNEMPGIETVPRDEPGGELHLNCSTRVAHETELSPAARHARHEAAEAARRHRGDSLRQEMALNRLQQAARGPERNLTTRDLADLLEAVEAL